MGTDCRITLPTQSRIGDVANVMGLLLGKTGELKPLQGGSFHLDVEGVKTVPSSMAECAFIHIDDAPLGYGEGPASRRIMYHYEYHWNSVRDVYTKSGHGMQPSCSALNIAMLVELARFFGGEVDYNDCDAKDTNFRAPTQPDLLVCNGKKWEAFQRRMAAVKPLTKEQIAKYQKYARY
jgi:hypothetical protein